MGTIESLMAGALCGVTYALFSGQPLTIVGATGPLLVFESILYHMCHENDVNFLSMRLWVGVWVTVYLLIMVMFDLSFLVRYITRFTEESFSILISLIFLYEALAKLFDIYSEFTVHKGVVREDPTLSCHCYPSEYMPAINYTGANSSMFLDDTTSALVPSNWTYKFPENCITFHDRLIVSRNCITEKACLQQGGNLTGSACFMDSITHSVPDVFFLSVILCIGTYLLAMAFREFRASSYLTSRVRNTVADFAVFMSVVTWTCIDYYFGISTPKLNVPVEFVNTRSDRTWVLDPFNLPFWLIPLASIPAILATILIFLDQQITAVIVNRKEHKLKKMHGYHLDLFVLAILICACAFLGLPWFVAATVRSLTHVKSLVRISEVSIPGEKPQMIGTREQRVTGICIHTLIGVSVLMTPILRIIPMPVLYGVFVYMGLTSLGDVQFIERFTVLFMPAKFQPDYIYLRHVKLRRVNMFTIIQVLCFAGMWTMKSIKATAIAFPVMLVVLMVARKLMDFVFTQSELYWLDHLLPEEVRRQHEDEKRRLEEGLQEVNGEKLPKKEFEAIGTKA